MPRAWLPGLAVVVVLLAAARSSGAQREPAGSRPNSVYPDISIEAATHLRTAASYIADQNWSEAIDLYQRLIESFPDKVVQVGSSPVYLTVPDYCHVQVATLPAAARALYRQRVDAQAESWYRAGLRERDRSLLMRVLNRAFNSSWGDDSLDALAEMAFEEGEFEEAHSLWTRLDTADRDGGNAPPGPRPIGPIYPDTNLDIAVIEAKKVLCHLFHGNKDAAAASLAEFRRRFPAARGRLGGGDGLLVDRLVAVAREPAPAPRPDDTIWSTFAGNPQRSKIVPQSVDIGSVQWTTPLPQTTHTRISGSKSALIANTTDESLSYHPIVLRDLVVVSGRDEVRAYDLHEGPKDGDTPLWTFRLRDLFGQAAVLANRPAFGAPHFTLTAERGRLYVRMGAPETTVPLRRGGQPDSYLVCLDLTADGKEIWRIQPEPSEPDLAFEGSPLVAGGNVYIGVTRGGAMTHSYLACYDAATGTKKWRKLICESSSVTPFFNTGTISHNLPTLGAGMVFFNTNLGAIAALDGRTGQIRWIATYGRDGRDDAPPNARLAAMNRELTPCIYYNGLVIAMPADGQGIHAFDALTGELRWRTPEPPQFAHMLGVAHGNLICTGSQVMAIDAATGKRVWQWSDTANHVAFGRGILAGEYVYFPTKTHIFVLDQRTGVLAKPKIALQDSHNQSPGNLVIGDGYLVVAQPKSLTVFCQYDVLINRYRELISANPRSPEPHFGLARAAEAGGLVALAIEHYRAAIELTAPDGPDDERASRQLAKTKLYGLLLLSAKRMAEQKEWSKVEEHYHEAATVAPSLPTRLDALLALAQAWQIAGEPVRAISVYQQVLVDESLRGLIVAVESNRMVRADVEVASRIDAVIEASGRAAFAKFEAEARQAFADAQLADSLPALERLLRWYPNAEVTSDVILYVANQHVERQEYSAAAAAFKQLLTRPAASSEQRASAMHGLARLHESQRLWIAARDWWQRLALELPDLASPADASQSITSFVADHLSRAPYDQIPTSAATDPLALPLARRWNRLWSEGTRIIVPLGTGPADLGLAMLASGPESLECVAAPSGQPLWTMPLAGPIRWSAFHEDQLLIGTDTRLLCVTAARGELRWEQKTESGLPGLAEFQLVDDRVFWREESRKLACVSARTGAPLWSFVPTEGTLLPHTYFGAQHVVLRTRQPGKLIVLDGDGRRRFELAQNSDPWERLPVLVDSHRLCAVADARTVQLIDLNDGKLVWSFVALNSDQRPIPIAEGGMLLVLVGGNSLTRLDVDTGKPLWSCRVSDDVLPRSTRSWICDGRTFYCATREPNLRAIRLSDRELEWEVPLTGPEGDWQVALAAGYVMALPRQPDRNDGLPVVICKQADGQLVQRLFFQPDGNDAMIHAAGRHTLVGSEREIWALAKD